MKYILSLIASLCIWFPTYAKNYLAEPTGQYAVGFQDFHFVNGTLINGSYSCPGNSDLLYIPGKNEKDFGKDNQVDFCREMMARVYYPIQKKKDLTYADYYKPAINVIQTRIRDAKIPEITDDQLKELEHIKNFSVNFTNKKSNIVNKKFPILIFSPGWGVQAQLYGDMTENMASHGYIVVAINNTFLANIQFPDGRLVAQEFSIPQEKMDVLAQYSILNDILFTKNIVLSKKLLPELINQMQLDHVGLFGHSVSGYPIMKAVRDNPVLFQAASYLDSGPFAFEFDTFMKYSPSSLVGFKLPFFRMHAANWNDPQFREMIHMPPDVQPELFNRNYFLLLSPSENNYTYSGHMSFVDYSTLQYQPTIKLFVEKEKTNPIYLGDPLGVGAANGWHTSKLINSYLLEFFDKYLKNKPAKNLNKCESIPDTILNCGSIENAGKSIKNSRKSQKISQKQIDKS